MTTTTAVQSFLSARDVLLEHRGDYDLARERFQWPQLDDFNWALDYFDTRAWGITIRDGYGQTETTAQVGNSPGQPVKPGSMGRPLPGYRVVLLDPDGKEAEEGEICLDLSARPLGLMTAYRDDDERTAEVMRGGYYHTGDVASRDAEGYITYAGRTDA